MSDLALLDSPLPTDRNPALVYLSSLPSAGSRRVQHTALKTMLLLMSDDDRLAELEPARFPWWRLRYQHVQAIRTRLMAQYAPATVNRHLSALRAVLKECWRLELIDERAYRLAIDVPNVTDERLPAGRHVSDIELRRLLTSCYDDGDKGVRDLTVMGLLATTGIRRAELAALNLKDFDPAESSLLIRGKGRKERTVYVVNTARKLLDEWLEVRSNRPGALFYSFHKGDKMTHNRFSAQAIYEMLGYRAQALGLKRLTPHDFRRTFIGNALDKGVDAATLVRVTGHASIEMLQRYDRRPESAKKDAQSKIDLPI